MTSAPKGPSKSIKPNRSQSERLWELARGVMPGGVSSPVRAFKAVGGTPVFLRRAQGPFVYDADGARYIDLVGSWGPAIAGQRAPEGCGGCTEGGCGWAELRGLLCDGGYAGAADHHGVSEGEHRDGAVCQQWDRGDDERGAPGARGDGPGQDPQV